MADRGRPTKRRSEIDRAICDLLGKGIPLTVICRGEHGHPEYAHLDMPCPNAVRDWMAADESFAALIARARELGEHAILEQCLQIADSPLTGEETEIDADGNVIKIKRADMLGHRKLQIETRLKLLAKWNPKKWGDRISQTVSGPDDGPLQIEHAGARDTLQARLDAIAAAAGKPPAT